MGWLPGDIFLVMHAGAATTNLALMQVTPDKSSLSMSSIRPVSGANIGDEHIDELFVQLVRQRLAADLATRPSYRASYHFAWPRATLFRKSSTISDTTRTPNRCTKSGWKESRLIINDFDHAGLGIQNGDDLQLVG